jgi:hypothetical protein
MITTDIEGGLGRSSSIAWCTCFVRRRVGFCEPVANFGPKNEIAGDTHKTKKVEKQLGETRKFD